MPDQQGTKIQSMEQVLEYIRKRDPERGEMMLAAWTNVRQRLDIVRGLQKDYGAEAAQINEGTGNLTPKDVQHLEELRQRLSNLNRSERDYSEQLVKMERAQLEYKSLLWLDGGLARVTEAALITTG